MPIGGITPNDANGMKMRQNYGKSNTQQGNEKGANIVIQNKQNLSLSFNRNGVQKGLSVNHQMQNRSNMHYATNQRMIGSNQSQAVATTNIKMGQNGQTYNQLSSNGIVRKKIENLPRTGIEYPMMKNLGHAPFLIDQLEFEPLADRMISQSLIDEYTNDEADRTASGQSFPVVYDYIDQSPYYDGENQKYGPYIDEKDLIELPNPCDQTNGAINEPYQKRYFFNPQNLPYNLEQSHQYG